MCRVKKLKYQNVLLAEEKERQLRIGPSFELFLEYVINKYDVCQRKSVNPPTNLDTNPRITLNVCAVMYTWVHGA